MEYVKKILENMENNLLLVVNLYHSSGYLSYHSLKTSQIKFFKNRIRMNLQVKIWGTFYLPV